eukprot:7014969-Pyramimonas_sp.AAC.2
MVASLGSALQGLALQLDKCICADDARGIGWWRAHFCSLPTEVEGLDTLTGAISTRVIAAWKAARSLSRARMKDWLLKALPKGAKKVHAWLKHDLGEPPQVLLAPQGVRQLPGDLLDYRQAFWSQVWHSPDGMSLLSGVLGALRPRALVSLEMLDPVEPIDVLRAARCFSNSTAVGVDSWAPR